MVTIGSATGFPRGQRSVRRVTFFIVSDDTLDLDLTKVVTGILYIGLNLFAISLNRHVRPSSVISSPGSPSQASRSRY